MKKYLKVESDHGLLRDVSNNAIVNNNFNEYEQFLQVSKLKYNEKKLSLIHISEPTRPY